MASSLLTHFSFCLPEPGVSHFQSCFVCKTLSFIQFLGKTNKKRESHKRTHSYRFFFNRQRRRETQPISVITGTFFGCFVANFDSFDNTTAHLSEGLTLHVRDRRVCVTNSN